MRSYYKDKVRIGATRIVILTRRDAIKIPRFTATGRQDVSRWCRFLQGLLSNLQERRWWGYGFHREFLCPVRFADPLGLIVVMPRCEEVSDEIVEEALVGFPRYSDTENGEYAIPIDPSSENFGLFQERVECLDYGS